MAKNTKLDAVVKLYRQWSTSILSPKNAFFKMEPDGSVLLQTFWKVRDLEQFKHTTFTKNYIGKQTKEAQVKFTSIGFPTDIGTESLSSVSPSGERRAVLRKITDPKGSKMEILEVWTKDNKIESIDLKNLDIHGDVCDDMTFGCLEWSCDEKKLLYVAEPKNPKFESFFSSKAEKNDNEPGIGHFREEWGEQLVGRHHPSLCIIDVETKITKSYSQIGLSCGQAIWGPEDKSIIFVAWDEEPRRLGLIFCPIRPNKLCSLQLEDSQICSIYEVDGWCVRSPRLSPDQTTLAFLNNPVGGPHSRCSRLSKYNLASGEHSTVVDIVQAPKGDDFPGIYSQSLPVKCWLNNQFLVFQSFWRSKQELVAVNMERCSIQRLTNDQSIGSWALVDLSEEVMIAIRSSFNVKAHFVFGKVSAISNTLTVTWSSVESDHKLEGIEMSIRTACIPDGVPFEALVSRPDDIKGQIPVIFIPHGGPHSVLTPQLYLSQILFNKLGFAVVMVNFRGSLGFGEESLESLLLAAGDQDVKEMVLITKTILNEDWADPKKIALYGGSYGGYLCAQLVGQHPNLYRACICRNPVVDINTTVDTSDIPDWSWVTAGLGNSYSSFVQMNPDVRQTFWEKSPARYLPNVTADFLMMLSKNDLRVPPSQGFNYYHQLKALGKAKTKLFVYDDDHSQSKVEVECDAFVRSALWLMEAFDQEDIFKQI